MIDDQEKHGQVQNIIRRSQALILNVQLLGADTSNAKQLLNSAKSALDKSDYNSAIEFAKKSMVEVMELKKQVKVSKGDKPLATSSDKRISDEIPAIVDTEEKIEKEKEKESQAIPGTDFEGGFSYLIEETRANECFNIMSTLADEKHIGLCICRTNPVIIRRKYNLKDNVNVLWLTDSETSKMPTISPSLESMIFVVEEFIDNNDVCVILLDGLEYLITNNSFNPVLRFLRKIIDKISETDSILLIAVSPKAIKEQELKLLERELMPVIIK